MSTAIDAFWEDNYQQGHAINRYPWDTVISFVFHHRPRDKSRAETRILEVGFGTGSNLLFAAREGFSVSGIEGSETAVAYARKRFEEEKLAGDLRVGDFTQLPFENDSFDLVIDRGALTCVGTSHLRAAIDEIRRVLRPGGKFHFNPYTDSHTSYCSGRQRADGLTHDIMRGSLTTAGPVRFTARREIDSFLETGWQMESVKRLELTEMLGEAGDIHAEWRVVASKLKRGS